MSAGRSRPSAASTWSRTVCLLVMLVPSRAPKLHGTPVESRRRGSRLSADRHGVASRSRLSRKPLCILRSPWGDNYVRASGTAHRERMKG